MKKIIAVVLIASLSGAAFSQTGLGVDKASANQKLDVNGWIEVGNQSAPGTGSAGTIRYNTSNERLQLHNGSGWVNLSIRATKFINWGRTDCPSSSTLIYSGFAGGTSYDQVGSGYQTLCLSSTPNWVDYNDGNHNGALVYGLEFETNSSYGVSTLFSYQNYDARCAVCQVENASTMLMVPGTTICPSGWSQQYWGYLVATHYTHRYSEFVCLNNTPTFNGSTANSNGDLWYPTEAELCSLRAPYVQNRELTCSVCTR